MLFHIYSGSWTETLVSYIRTSHDLVRFSGFERFVWFEFRVDVLRVFSAWFYRIPGGYSRAFSVLCLGWAQNHGHKVGHRAG